MEKRSDETKTFVSTDTQTEMSLTELANDLNAKLDSIQAVIGFILEKTNLIHEPMRQISPSGRKTTSVEKNITPIVIENKINCIDIPS